MKRKKTIIVVNDKMQSGYVYERVAREGADFAADFRPQLSPEEMLALGVFEGHYMTDCIGEFPLIWFERAKLSPAAPDVGCNCFKVKSRQPLSVWREKGWILPPDPRGWFQWYCRYYSGRRLPETDAVQIGRWRAFRRHAAQIAKNCRAYDFSCRPRQRQALLQWAYNPFI